MAKNREKTYWPHMILGFLILGITLSYWTIKSASSMPVQESNQYMLKYQVADININEIIEKKILFDKSYNINIIGVEKMIMSNNINSNRPQLNAVKLSKGINSFHYSITDKDGLSISDVNVTFLLTQPHSVREDQIFYNIPYIDKKYIIKNILVKKAGRYTLQFRAEVANVTGYSEIPAYLNP